jgi:5-hydroxyisourate hydrolase
MSGLSTHVLDTSTGLPAAGVEVIHYLVSGGTAEEVGRSRTDDDGRVRDLLNGAPLTVGHHRIEFGTGAWMTSLGRPAFYPIVSVDFDVSEPQRHHHIPLLLSPFGYSTYRGS